MSFSALLNMALQQAYTYTELAYTLVTRVFFVYLIVVITLALIKKIVIHYSLRSYVHRQYQLKLQLLQEQSNPAPADR